MKNNSKYLPALSVFTCLIFCSTFFSAGLKAQGNLLIMPKRVVFEGNKRSESLNLANTGKETATYIISLIQIRMNEDGSFEKITDPDNNQLFADKNIRFYPRTVTLAPNEAQTVKIQVIKQNEMVIGEYRSHLYFRANPAPKPLGEEVVNPKDSSLSVKLTPIFGISIPVILRKGVSNAVVNITDVRFDNKGKDTAITVTFKRSGNMSVYGDVLVDHISPQGLITRVAVVKGMAVYTPGSSRRFHMILDKTAGVNYRQGKLKVAYVDQSAKAVSLANYEIDLR